MGLSTRPISSERAQRALQILKFRVNWANIEQDTTIQKLQNLLRNIWISGHFRTVSGNPYQSGPQPELDINFPVI